MACDVDVLLADGACYTCLSEKQRQIARLSLLCSISEAIGGGGGGGGGIGGTYRVSSDPEGSQVAGFSGSIAYNPNTGEFWTFGGTVGTSTGWVKIIG